MSTSRKRLARPALGLAALATIGLVASACSSSSSPGKGSSSSPSGSGSATSLSSQGITGSATGSSPGKSSNTVTWAEAPAATPNYIFPFSALQYFSVTNSGQFQQLMYRPLYWYGDNTGTTTGGPNLNADLSPANAPVYSGGGKTITITMKGWKWSNGETVSAQDVMFWFNMEKAEKANFAAYVPGTFPDNVTSAKVTSPNTIVFTTDKAYSQQWFNENELSQITPMPAAWDLTAAGTKGTCMTSESGCKAVYTYLAKEAKDLTSYASSPIWSIVDGPWKLSSFNSDGHVSFVPNSSYGGPIKPSIKQFNEVPYTTDKAEYNVLQSGSTLDVGYITNASLTGNAKSPTEAGPNPISSKYTLDPWFLYGINYFPINFNNPKTGPLFKQLYIRQAIQSSVDQEGIILAAAKGYGAPTLGPIPTIPDSQLVSTNEKTNLYPFSTSKAANYLSSNGWKVNANGVSTCEKPGTGSGECGSGISQGEGLKFKLQYASGNATIDTAMADLKSNLSKIGIEIDLTQAPFNTVLGIAVPSNKTWDMENWGGGWTYSPDYYPSGETLFQTGSGSNSGSYSDSQADALIKATTTESGTGPMHAYADYLAKNLPVIWQPNYTYSLTEVANGLKGFGPQNPFGALTPEDWHY